MEITNQPFNQPLMKKHFFIACIGILLGLSISYYLVLSEQEENVTYTAPMAAFAMIAGVAISYAVYGVALVLDKWLPWRKHAGNRLLIGLLLHFSIATIIAVTITYCYDFIYIGTEYIKVTYELPFIKLIILLFITTLIFEIIYFALYSYYAYSTLQIAVVKHERKQIELQLKALKSQLSPHFLFNGLNTISSLAYKSKTKAIQFIRGLAGMYAYTLQSYDIKMISLREELAFVKDYLYLVETRFEDKLQCQINISEELLDTKIPPLTLQMLVENAVKHNVLSDEHPLCIKITSDQKEITVQNNITEKPIKVTSFNIGLKNINARYLLLADKGISITNGQHFTVKIPIIRT